MSSGYHYGSTLRIGNRGRTTISTALAGSRETRIWGKPRERPRLSQRGCSANIRKLMPGLISRSFLCMNSPDKPGRCLYSRAFGACDGARDCIRASGEQSPFGERNFEGALEQHRSRENGEVSADVYA